METKRKREGSSLIMRKIAKTTKTSVKKSQAKTDFELAIQVSDRIQLDTVRLMGCNCKQKHLVGPGQKGFQIKRTTDSSMDEGTNRVFVLANFTLKTFETGANDKEPFAVIEALFLLIYQADSLQGITKKAVDFFGKTNGIYNAWPYWREFVQNTIVRMGLPPLTIPVFRIFAPKKPKTPKKKVAAKTKSLPKKKTTKKTKGRVITRDK